MDYPDYLKFVVALFFVLGLIGLSTVLLRRFGYGGAMRLGRRMRGQERRLDIVEVAPIDARRRLVLIRCDDQEYLVLLGINNDVVIESGITAPVQDKHREDDEEDNQVVSTPKPGFRDIVSVLRGERE